MDVNSNPGGVFLEQISKQHEKRIIFGLGETGEQDERHYLVGRTPECDLRLDSVAFPLFVSRQHARISLQKNEIFITDLKSVNGTFVNDEMLRPSVTTRLNIGDTVTFGCVSPDKTIIPGTLVKQEDPVFKFILKKSQDDGLQYQDSAEDTDLSKVERENLLPLTVGNLIAYAGCSFPADNKDNSRQCIKSKEKRVKKRRKTNFYTRRRKAAKEFCEFFECKIAQTQLNCTVSWVQCDDCDKWFHTNCIGCDYDSVRSNQTKFHCGQC